MSNLIKTIVETIAIGFNIQPVVEPGQIRERIKTVIAYNYLTDSYEVYTG